MRSRRRAGDPPHRRPAVRLRGLPGALAKIAPGLSAGRVQSVAIRLVVDRERERIAFRSRRLLGHRGRRSRPGAVRRPGWSSVDGAPGRHRQRLRPATVGSRRPTSCCSTSRGARRSPPALDGAPFTVRSVEQKPVPAARPPRRSSPRPCSRRPAASCAGAASATMRVAQRCTRTATSPTCVPTRRTLSEQAITAARAQAARAVRRRVRAGRPAQLRPARSRTPRRPTRRSARPATSFRTPGEVSARAQRATSSRSTT